MTDSTAVLLARINELQRKLHNQRERTYEARAARDRWKARHDALLPHAREHKRWLSHLSQITNDEAAAPPIRAKATTSDRSNRT